MPIIEKYSNNDHTKLLTNNENPKISFASINQFNSNYNLISQSGVFQQQQNNIKLTRFILYLKIFMAR